MPASWNTDDFQSGGLKGISKFNGQLTEIEEDIVSKFEHLQMALYFDEAEVLESVDDVSLPDGKYTDWIKQSNRTGSVNEAFVNGITKFIHDHKLKGGVPDALYGVNITWERQEVTPASDDGNFSAGRCLLPIALVEAPKKERRVSITEETPTTTRRRRAEPEPEDEAPLATEGSEPSIPSELTTFIINTVGEDGATRDLIRRDITKKTTLKKLQTAAGGLDTVLAHMVEANSIVEEDGTYFLPDDE